MFQGVAGAVRMEFSSGKKKEMEGTLIFFPYECLWTCAVLHGAGPMGVPVLRNSH